MIICDGRGSADFRGKPHPRERYRSRTAAIPRSHVSSFAISKICCFSNGGREVVGGTWPPLVKLSRQQSSTKIK
jgi:hypothetical protein